MLEREIERKMIKQFKRERESAIKVDHIKKEKLLFFSKKLLQQSTLLSVHSAKIYKKT
jgi:hypothetical protein